MKKLIVVDEETNSKKASSVAEFFSLHFNYGLYDFDAEKLLQDVAEKYDVHVKNISLPYYDLEDNEGGKIKVMFKEEYV